MKRAMLAVMAFCLMTGGCATSPQPASSGEPSRDQQVVVPPQPVSSGEPSRDQQVVVLPQSTRDGRGLTAQTAADEPGSWESAKRAGTPTAFAEYFREYPSSPRTRTQTGTVRGRYWFKINDPDHLDGVIVTVKGTDLVMNVSVEEARRLRVITSRPTTPGQKNKALGRTFNYIYGEIVEGGFTVAREINGEVVCKLIEPRDNVDATIVTNADGTRLLTWDLSKAKISTHPDPNPTFPAAAAGTPPFNDIPAGLSKELTPESQVFSVSTGQK